MTRKDSLILHREILESIIGGSEALKNHKSQRNENKGESQLDKGKQRKRVRTSDKARKGSTLHNADDQLLKPMPMSEWKIIFNKKDTQKEPEAVEFVREGATASGEGGEIGAACPEEFLGPDGDHTGAEEAFRSPRASDRWQVHKSDLAAGGKSLWTFPMLPGRCVRGTSWLRTLLPRRPVPRRVQYQSMFCFEVLARKVTIHPRPYVLKVASRRTARDGVGVGVIKLNTVHIGVQDAADASQHNTILNHQPGVFPTRKRITAANGQSKSMYPRQLSTVHPGQEKSVNAEEFTKIITEKNFLYLDEKGRIDQAQGVSPSQPCKGEVRRSLLRVKNVGEDKLHSAVRLQLNSDREHTRPFSGTVNGTNGTVESSLDDKPEFRARNKFMELLRRKGQVNSSWTESSGSDDVTDSDSDDAKLLNVSKKTRRRKRSRVRKTKRTQKTSNTNDSELVKLDFLSHDVLAELLKLQHPIKRERFSSAENASNIPKKKKRRKRKGSQKKSAEKSRRLKEQLLVTLSRNTAFWYDVTSRLQSVTRRQETTSKEGTSSAAASTSTNKKRLKAAVHSLKNLEGEALNTSEVSKTSEDSPSEASRLPPVSHTSRTSKFVAAASAVITAERNYYNLLPPLASPWSHALDDLFPSVRQVWDPSV